jgi:hypothetical protein
MARTQATGTQIKDGTVQTLDLEDRAVTDIKLSTTGTSTGTFTKLTVNDTGRITAGAQAVLADLANVSLSSLSPGQALIYNGSNWVNGANAGVLFLENPVTPTPSTAEGDNSVTIGQGAHALANNSVAIGDQSLSRYPGITQASGRFASSGDAQTGKYLLRSSTINASPTELFLDGTGGSQRLTIADDSTWVFDITVVGHQTNASTGHAGFRVRGVIYKTSVNTLILGSVNIEVLSSHANWSTAVTADTTNGSLKITVTGEASKTIRWLAVVETTEVTN